MELRVPISTNIAKGRAIPSLLSQLAKTGLEILRGGGRVFKDQERFANSFQQSTVPGLIVAITRHTTLFLFAAATTVILALLLSRTQNFNLGARFLTQPLQRTTASALKTQTPNLQRQIRIPTHTIMSQNAIPAADGAKLAFAIRPSHERGNADHGWLKSFHTFNFANYHDPRFEKWGNLRVINEDRVDPKEGFGEHAHREFEIFSYIVSGELEHRDSMGNVEVMRRGDVQLTSAGTGIRHSEMTHGKDPVHFLQIWSLPSTRGLPPKYYARHFTDESKRLGWAPVVGKAGDEGVSDAREGEGPTPVHTPLYLYATLLAPGKTVQHNLKMSKGYLHVVQTSGYNTEASKGNKIKVNGGLELSEGDGAFVTRTGDPGETVTVENIGDGEAELLLFDLD